MLCFDRWLAFVTHDIVKYLLAAGGVYVLVYGVLAARLASRRLQTACAEPQADRPRGRLVAGECRHLRHDEHASRHRSGRARLEPDVLRHRGLGLALRSLHSGPDDRRPRRLFLLDAPADASPGGAALGASHAPPLAHADALDSLCVPSKRGRRAGRLPPAVCGADTPAPADPPPVERAHGRAQCPGARRFRADAGRLRAQPLARVADDGNPPRSAP